MRTEYKTDDRFKSYWRPFFGWVIASSFGLFMISIVAIIVTLIVKPEAGSMLVSAVTQLTPVLMTAWGMGLTVLGVNIHKRSQDKAVSAGLQAPGMLDGFKGLLTKSDSE